MNLLEKFTQYIADKVSQAIAARMAELFAANVVTVAKMTYKPGDTIVIKAKRHVSKMAFDHINDSLRENFPGVKGIILEEDMDIAVIEDKSYMLAAKDTNLNRGLDIQALK